MKNLGHCRQTSALWYLHRLSREDGVRERRCTRSAHPEKKLSIAGIVDHEGFWLAGITQQHMLVIAKAGLRSESPGLIYEKHEAEQHAILTRSQWSHLREIRAKVTVERGVSKSSC